jgi:hypothetical protein
MVEPNETVIFLAIFASLASYWGLSLCKSAFFPTPQVSVRAGVWWLRTAMDVLEHVRRSATPTIETAQATMLLMFLVYHIEGFSPKVRAMLFSALAVAKDLGLHRTDDVWLSFNGGHLMGNVEKEMRRRVWWYLACTDWYGHPR